MRTKDPNLLQRIEDYVKEYCEEYGHGPSVTDVSEYCSLSRSGTYNYLKKLVDDERLTQRSDNTFVSYMIADEEDTVPCMILGTVSCGPLTNVEQCYEGYLRLPTIITGGKGKFYILHAKGNSMVDAGINNGDLVLIRKQETANIGDIIVALVGDEVTLKRLEYNNKKKSYYLHPENEEYEDIYVDKLQVQGVAIRTIKNII